MICLYCNKKIDEEKKVDGYYCSEECSEKESIRQELETYEIDEIRCPYCEEIYSDLDSEYEAIADLFECPNCHEEFILTAYTSTSFTANVTEAEINRRYKEMIEEV